MKIRYLFVYLLITRLLNINCQNLVLNSDFDDYRVYKDENDKLVYSPKYWYYDTKDKNHPIYFSTERFLDKSLIDNKYFHPDYRLILEGKTKLNYLSVPILPTPKKIFTELSDSLTIDQSYKLELAIKIFDYSTYFADLIVGFSKNRPDNIDTSSNQLKLHIHDSITWDYLRNNWVLLSAEFKAVDNEKYLIIGSGRYIDYEKIINSNPKRFCVQNGHYFKLNYLVDNVILTQLKNNNSLQNKIDSLKIGESCILDNIFFEFDKSELLEKSFIELNKLTQYLKANPNLRIVIVGHTDNVGTDSYNHDLSYNRAKSVVNFLVSQRVNIKRLQFDGKGAGKPITSNETEIGRQKNRRVEIIILEK